MKAWLTRFRVPVIAIAALLVVGAVLAAGPRDSKPSGQKKTLVEVVCDDLRDGHSQSESRELALILARNHTDVYGDPEQAADLAVSVAVGQGCAA